MNSKDKIIEIDEEGYPLSNGLRFNDDKFIFELYSGLGRLIEGELKSPIVSRYQGKEIFVHAFSDILVAQSVVVVSKTKSIWHMPGGFKIEVSNDNLYQDKWDRIRSWYSDDFIPAVMSSKAQTDFLQKTDLGELKLKTYRPSENEVETDTMWNSRYLDSNTGWDLDAPTPLLLNHSLPEFKKGQKVLVPGAGMGHDANYLTAKLEAELIAVDFSKEAQRLFHKKYPDSKLKYLCDDLFEYLKQNKSIFDGIFEHTIFCAISPKKRTEYLSLVTESLKPGAYYFGTFFLKTSMGGPPFGVTQWELQRHLEKDYNIKQWQVSQHSVKNRQHLELWTTLQKK